MNLSRSLPGDVTLRTNCEVTKITNTCGGTTTSINVEAEDGFFDAFDDVVVTAPLGWLKRSENVFSPPLSPDLSSAIRSLGYGNLDRVFVKFPKAFWNDDSVKDGYHRGSIVNSQDPAFPVESLFLRPEYADDTNPARWRQEIISFSGLPEPFSQPVVMFFVYGQWGRHIAGLVRGMEQESREYYQILEANFQPYYSKLHNYDPASPSCKPVGFMSTDWQNDRLAGFGSFTYLPIDSGDCFRHFEVLREGAGEERGIWFAGEHTSPAGGLGTVTGAYWSGEEVAKRLVQRSYTTISS